MTLNVYEKWTLRWVNGISLETSRYVCVHKRVRGVVWIVEDAQWNLVMVVENEKKPWKKPGQLSFVMETVERWETDWQALLRGLREELWIQKLDKLDILPQDLIIPLYVYDSDKQQSIIVYLSVFMVQLSSTIEEQLKNFTSNEIKQVKVFSLEDFLNQSKFRPWVKEAFTWKETVTVIVDGEYFNDN